MLVWWMQGLCWWCKVRMRDSCGCRARLRASVHRGHGSKWADRHSSSWSQEKIQSWEKIKDLDTLTVSCNFLFDFSTSVCRRALLLKVCVSAPPRAAPSPSGPPSWSLGSPGLSETGREAPRWQTHRGRTCRRGSPPDLRLKKKDSFVAWNGWKWWL